MPNYDYHHVKCIHDFENVRSVSRRIEAECSNCKSISKQQLSVPAVIQNGFYEQGKYILIVTSRRSKEQRGEGDVLP
jgi:putative FmdB family regulatory protein